MCAQRSIKLACASAVHSKQNETKQNKTNKQKKKKQQQQLCILKAPSEDSDQTTNAQADLNLRWANM